MKSPTKQKWDGRWDQLKGRVKKLWGDITDDDMKRVEGNYDRMLGMLEEKTGKAREEIERQLDE
jgi:uncharacterized protein YjbJ (UPF0337 family)